MDITKKADRNTLKTYFVKNAIPTASNFSDLIEGGLNQREDGIAKLPGEPLSIQADGDAASQRKAINFYKSFSDPEPAWTMSLNPRTDPANAATARAGLSFGDSNGQSRLFIDQATGQVGIGTIAPTGQLEVNGVVAITNGSGVAAASRKMAAGSLTIGGTNSSFGGGNSWNANTAGLLMETAANTEIAVHDSNHRLASLMYYEGDASNRVVIGRNMGWGPLDHLLVNCDIRMPAGKTLSAPDGRMHITGGELLYLLNKDGVVIGREWGGNGNLQVQGRLMAGAVRVTRHTANVSRDIALSTANGWADFPDLLLKIQLNQESEVMVYYGIVMPCQVAGGHLVTRMIVDDAEQREARSITGNTQYWSPGGTWFATLGAGSHVIRIQYRTPHGGTFNPGQDWQKASLTAVVFGMG